MTKLTRALALSGMLAVAAGTLSVAPAQDKGAKKAAAKKGGTIRYHQSPKNERYYFSLYDADDKFLFSSPAKGYDTKDDVVKAVDAIRAALDGAKLELKKADDKDDDKDEKKDKKEPKKEKKGG